MTNHNQQLLESAQSGDLKKILLALESGADVNCLDEHGSNSLHIATQNNCIEIVEALIAAKININALTPDGWTAMHFAAVRGYEEIAKMLIEAGIDVRVAGLRYKRTALHYAADQGRSNVVYLLLNAGADKNAADIENHTPIFLAERKGYEETAQLLRS